MAGASRAAALLVLLLAPWGAAGGPVLAKRQPLGSHPPQTAEHYEAMAQAIPHRDFRVFVKFRDAARFRVVHRGDARGGLADGAPQLSSALEGCAGQVAAAAEQLGLTTAAIRPVFGSLAGELEGLLKRAEERSGRAQPDLQGLVEIRVPDNSASRLVDIRSAFERVGCTEYTSVSLGPPPLPRVVRQPASADCLPACSPGKTCSVPTGDCTPFYIGECNRNLHEYSSQPAFGDMQGYRKAEFLDVDYAASEGALGQGVVIADVEWWFLTTHQCLQNQSVVLNEPYVPAPTTDADHGTAVQSILVGNEHLPGIAPKSTSSFWSDAAGYSFHQVIIAAGATLKAGDVLLYEAADRVSPSCPCAGGTNAADILMEVEPAIFDTTRALTDAGIIVVEAAGNGNVDLDLSYSECPCLGYNLTAWRSWGDSGAIVVGAGTPDEQRAKEDFSTYGTRVDVQAWGKEVMSASSGLSGWCGACRYLEDFSVPGHPEIVIQQCDSSMQLSDDRNLQYQGGFSGTSSASAISAGAVAALQSYNTAVLGRAALLPAEMRRLLVETGAPQGGPDAAEKPIGPLIKLRPAMERLAGGRGEGRQQASVARHLPEEVDVGSFLQAPRRSPRPAGEL